jgi:hypothetical protein
MTLVSEPAVSAAGEGDIAGRPGFVKDRLELGSIPSVTSELDLRIAPSPARGPARVSGSFFLAVDRDASG